MLRALRVFAVALAAAAGAWILVLTTAATLGGGVDAVTPAAAIAAIAFAGSVGLEVALEDQRQRRLLRFGAQMRAGSDVNQDVRGSPPADDAIRAALERRWVEWDAATSALVDSDGREGDHDLYHRPLPAGHIGTAPRMSDWQLLIERDVDARLDRLREIMSRL
jgi:hypothetical protein